MGRQTTMIKHVGFKVLRGIMREKIGGGGLVLDKVTFDWTPEHGSEPIQLHGKRTLGWSEVNAKALRYAWDA